MPLSAAPLDPTPEQNRERVRFIRQQADKLTDEEKKKQLWALAEKIEKRGSEPGDTT